MRPHVFLVTETGEADLGTVEEITFPGWPEERGEGGPGESFEALLADIVATMISDNADEEFFRIEIREGNDGI